LSTYKCGAIVLYLLVVLGQDVELFGEARRGERTESISANESPSDEAYRRNVGSSSLPTNEQPYIHGDMLQLLDPRQDIYDYFTQKCAEYENIIEIGPGGIDRRFPPATHVVDHMTNYFDTIPNVTSYNVDLDYATVPVSSISNDGPKSTSNMATGKQQYLHHHPEQSHHKPFEFLYARHFLEDIHNPAGAFREMVRLSSRGYIETPSPMMECLPIGRPDQRLGLPMRGYVHHRWLLYTNWTTNTLYAIPKMPILEYIHFGYDMQQKWVDVITEHVAFANNYYYWDVNDPRKQPKLVVVKHEVDFQLSSPSSYRTVILSSIGASVNNSLEFFNEHINPFIQLQHAHTEQQQQPPQ